jgi:hypothetical protein
MHQNRRPRAAGPEREAQKSNGSDFWRVLAARDARCHSHKLATISGQDPATRGLLYLYELRYFSSNCRVKVQKGHGRLIDQLCHLQASQSMKAIHLPPSPFPLLSNAFVDPRLEGTVLRPVAP